MVKKGDHIEILMNKAGQVPRRGVVERVIEEDPLRLEVRWDTGGSTVLMPHAGNLRVLSSS